MFERRRVVITGVGIVSPLGLDEPTLWRNLLAGQSAIRPIRSLPVADHRTRNGAEVDDAALAAALEAIHWKPLDRTVDMAALASASALQQAGLGGTPHGSPRREIATIFGTGNGPSHTASDTHRGYAERGARGLRPTAIVRGMTNVISSQISIRFGLTGPNYVVVSACASSSAAIGIAFRMIRSGDAEQVLCGGADSYFVQPTYAAWDRLGVLSRAADPALACRPFDRDRDGFVLGEGAAALLVESLDGALKRGACIRGEIAGFAECSDATHITRPSEEGHAKAILMALRSASVAPSDIALINAHGTATPAGDEAEWKAIQSVMGAAAEAIPVSANKSAFGHTVGAAAALETIVAMRSLETGLVPPHPRPVNPDPGCRLHFVDTNPAPVSGAYALKTTFAFGGHDTALVLRRYEGATA